MGIVRYIFPQFLQFRQFLDFRKIGQKDSTEYPDCQSSKNA